MSAFRIKYKKSALYLAVSAGVLLSAPISTCFAAELEELVVQGTPVYRDRTLSVSPELEYGLDFFQQFEPTSVGDMLKRTPGVGFSSDVGEYDAPQLRGLGEGYTQVLINGRRVPGSGADRSVLVDRIPAELVDRIQIIRSPSADQDSQGVGGTINIILKDGASLEGGSMRLGLLNADNQKYRRSVGLSYGAQNNNIAWSLSGVFQERYVPKAKLEEKSDPDGTLNEREFEDDIRDSDDISLGGNVSFTLSDKSSLDLNASFVSTSRKENETARAFESDDSVFVLEEVALQSEDIEEDTFVFSAVYNQELPSGAEWVTSFDYSTLDAQADNNVFEIDGSDFLAGDVPFEHTEVEVEDISDEEFVIGTSLSKDVSDVLNFKVGLEGSSKERDETVTVTEPGDDSLVQTYDAEESRVNAYLVGGYKFGEGALLELGVRVEHTERNISNNVLNKDTSDTQVNPSAHLSYDFGDAGTFRLSLARTVRRPGFDQLSPTIEFDEPEDGDAKQGNPDLADEVSNGLDIGYERRIMSRGIVGINAFYRDVTDVIEEVGVGPGIDSDGNATSGILSSFNNTGDGEVWGIEFDLNLPITANTGLFANYTWLDSEITDSFTGRTRTFRDQSEFIYNVGVTHNIPSWDSSVGFSYQQQGNSLSVDIDRDVILEYDGNLEVFVEKRFSNDYVLRLTGNNLLDAEKREFFDNFDGDSAEEIIANHIAGNVDELEREVETAGPVITLTLRKSF